MLEKISSLISVSALSITILLFSAINGISYLLMQSRLRDISDAYAECGFPFSLYGQGGFAPVSQVLWPGLIADYLAAMSASAAIGVMWKRRAR